MMYKFHEDMHGEVVAECKAPEEVRMCLPYMCLCVCAYVCAVYVLCARGGGGRVQGA